MRLTLAASLLAGSVAFGSGVEAQQLDKKQFNVVGTWNFLTNWQELEQPFWTEDLPKASGGKIKGNLKSVTEVNLKGTEVLRLLKQGVFDFAAALPIYVEDGGAVIEAVDIAGVARSFEMAARSTDAWMPEMQKVMKERHNAHDPSTFPWPEQDFYCSGEIKSIADLKGKKVRVQGTSQADLVACARRLGRDDRLRRGRAGAREGRGGLRHHGHDARLQGEVAGSDQHVVPAASRLHGRHLGGQSQSWNKLSPGYAGASAKEMKALEDKSWKIDQGGDGRGRRLHDRHGEHARSGRRKAEAGQAVRGRPQGARQGAQRRRAEELGQTLRRRLRRQVERAGRQEVRPRG